MNGFLSTYKSTAYLDFQQKENFKNWIWGLKRTTSVNMLAFYINDNIPTGKTISTFSIRNIKINPDATITVLSTESLSTAYVDIDSGTTYDIYSYAGDTDLGVSEVGLYQFYVENSDGSSWVTDVFCFNNLNNTQSGDFNNDFNDDFLNSTSYTASGITKITAKFLPNIYPNVNYIDEIYICDRIIRLGTSETIIETAEDFAVVDEPNFTRKRLVQTTSYDVYKVKIFASESSRIDLLEKAEYVNLQTDQNKTYRLKVIEPISGEKQDKTELRLFTIVFEDINPANYVDNKQPVSNFLTAENLRSAENGYYSDDSLVRFTISTQRTIDSTFSGFGNTYTFYGKLVPRFPEEVINTTHNQDGVIYEVQSISNSQVKVRLYLTEEEKNIFAKYADKCEKKKVRYDGDTFENNRATSRLAYTIKEGNLTNLYEVDLILTHEQLITNSMDEATLQTYGSSVAHRIRISNSETIDNEWVGLGKSLNIYTLITPNLVPLKGDKLEDKLGSGIKEISTTQSYKVANCTFYVDSETCQRFIKYHDMCDAEIISSVLNDTAVQYIDAKWSKVETGNDLYRIDVNLIYENLIYNPYE